MEHGSHARQSVGELPKDTHVLANVATESRIVNRIGLWLAALCLSMSLLGCSQDLRPKNSVPVFSVTGALTYDGQPMNGAVITFHPAHSKLTAQGVADSSGKYSLTTYLTNDGAAAGDYVVTIHWPTENVKAQADDSDPPLAPDRLKDAYTNAKTTKLQATVREKPNTIDFKLP